MNAAPTEHYRRHKVGNQEASPHKTTVHYAIRTCTTTIVPLAVSSTPPSLPRPFPSTFFVKRATAVPDPQGQRNSLPWVASTKHGHPHPTPPYPQSKTSGRVRGCNGHRKRRQRHKYIQHAAIIPAGCCRCCCQCRRCGRLVLVVPMRCHQR